MAADKKYNLSNLPPPNSPELGRFLVDLFEQARSWKKELHLEQRWNECHRLIRGRHWPKITTANDADKDKISLPLGQANVIRTCSNLVGSSPKLQVKSQDGLDEDETAQFKAEQIFSTKLLNWWEDEEQQPLLFDSCFAAEVYNITFEKSRWRNGRPEVYVVDPYAAYPARGNWRRLGEQVPYFFHLVKRRRDDCEKKFGLAPGELQSSGSRAREELGEYREDNKPDSRGITTVRPLRAEGSNFSPESRSPKGAVEGDYVDVLDCWIRDYSMETVTISAADVLAQTADPDDRQGGFEVLPLPMESGKMNVEIVEHSGAGVPAMQINACPFDGHSYATYGIEPVTIPLRADAAEVYKLPGDISVKYTENEGGPSLIFSRLCYPGGIRNIVLTRDGRHILADRGNPSINHQKPRWMTKETYLYSRFPFYYTNSKRDPMSMWGMGSDLELTASINLHIDDMISRAVRFMKLVVWPLFVVPQGSNISEEDFSNIDFNLLQPTAYTAPHIRFIQMHAREHLNAFFESLAELMQLFDRLWQIHDVARGEVPYSGMSAQSILSLQEQASIPLLPKIQAANYLVRERGRCALSHFLNHHNTPEWIEVQKNSVKFQGDEYLGRRLAMHVKSGSTLARTEAYLKEIALALHQYGLLPKKQTLEMLEVPGAQEIAEQLGEGRLGLIMQELLDAGLESAIEQGIISVQPEVAGLPALGEGATAEDAARVILQVLLLNQPQNTPRNGQGRKQRPLADQPAVPQAAAEGG